MTIREIAKRVLIGAAVVVTVGLLILFARALQDLDEEANDLALAAWTCGKELKALKVTERSIRQDRDRAIEWADFADKQMRKASAGETAAALALSATKMEVERIKAQKAQTAAAVADLASSPPPVAAPAKPTVERPRTRRTAKRARQQIVADRLALDAVVQPSP